MLNRARQFRGFLGLVSLCLLAGSAAQAQDVIDLPPDIVEPPVVGIPIDDLPLGNLTICHDSKRRLVPSAKPSIFSGPQKSTAKIMSVPILTVQTHFNHGDYQISEERCDSIADNNCDGIPGTQEENDASCDDGNEQTVDSCDVNKGRCNNLVTCPCAASFETVVDIWEWSVSTSFSPDQCTQGDHDRGRYEGYTIYSQDDVPSPPGFYRGIEIYLQADDSGAFPFDPGDDPPGYVCWAYSDIPVGGGRERGIGGVGFSDRHTGLSEAQYLACAEEIKNKTAICPPIGPLLPVP